MAEYCLECWNEINGISETEDMYIFSDYYELCEGCGELKKVVIIDKKTYHIILMKRIFFPFVLIWKIIYLIFRIFMIPHTIYLFHKLNKEKKTKDD